MSFVFYNTALCFVINCNWRSLAVVKHMDNLIKLNYCYYINFIFAVSALFLS
jgi:hypothetical protein